MEDKQRVEIQISGVVQGVGFRPTVYKYATELRLSGFVNNTSSGVTIEVQGRSSDVNCFIEQLKNYPPPRSVIDSFDYRNIEVKHGRNVFEIVASAASGDKTARISADLNVCLDCLDDIRDKNGRRYRYPFTNCTNCGPRYSIINDRPYDRRKTSMKDFRMCSECQAEYDDPLNRRFHAQPNACSKCGPSMYVLGRDNVHEPLNFMCDQIKEGAVLALKGVGGFNIVCDPFNHETLLRLRASKRRPHQSFALMMKDISTVERYCRLDACEREALLGPEAPIVLLRKNSSALDTVSPDNNYLGVMLPYTPMHHLIMDAHDVLVMTSANLRDEPIAINDEEVLPLQKNGVVDFIVGHNRPIVNRTDDSIIQFVNGRRQVIRRGRGLVPTPYIVGFDVDSSILALGSNMKNTFTVARGKQFFVSSHIGELTDARSYKFQQQSIQSFSKILDIAPQVIRCDAHPGFENYDEGHHRIYHHHAHALSCMGENQLLGERVLAVVCDGIGFGDDGNVWGFEFLEIEQNWSYSKRRGHLRYFPLPGGDKAQREIVRTAISLLSDIGGVDLFCDPKSEKIKQIVNNRQFSPLCSSLGRLFDGVAAILKVTTECEYDARGAIQLQAEAEKYIELGGDRVVDWYPVEVSSENGIFILEYQPMIRALCNDLKCRRPVGELAYKFHLWVVDAIWKMIELLNYNKVVFSGGCFQNRLLMTLIMQRGFESEINIYFNWEVPTNDAGISFGQALIKESACV